MRGRPPLDDRDQVRLEARVPAEWRRRVRIAALAAGQSLQDYLVQAVDERMTRDQKRT